MYLIFLLAEKIVKCKMEDVKALHCDILNLLVHPRGNNLDVKNKTLNGKLL